MKAKDHTRWLLRWWQDVGITRADVAVKRPTGQVIWHHDLRLDQLPLAWARAENVRQAEIYIRPARQRAWPLVFLDDVAAPLARRVVGKYDAMAVQTSTAGGCHLWLACDRPMAEGARRDAQRWLARRVGADLGSVSGEHLGRLAGVKNWKRGGTWVNVLDASRGSRLWAPVSPPGSANRRLKVPGRSSGQPDASASGRDWGWVCGLLEAGWPADLVHDRLVEKARIRQRPNADQYARRTLLQALWRTGAQPQRRVRPP
jgi:hypothetical protein